MAHMFDGIGLGKEFFDSGLKSVASLSRGTQAIIEEAADFTKKAHADGTATLEKLLSVKSLESAVEIQTDYARQAYEGFVAETTKIGGLYVDLAKDAYKPFETVVAKAT